MRTLVSLTAAGLMLLLAGCAALYEARAPTSLPTEEQHLSRADGEQGCDASNALAHIEKATELDPNSWSLYVFLASAYLRDEQYDKAISIMERACRVFPRSSEAHGLLALACQSGGRSDAAIREYRRAIRLDPSRSDNYIRLCAIFLERNDDAGVLKTMDRGLKFAQDPQELMVFCDYLAKACILNQKLPQAIACLTRIEARQPDNLQVKEQLARCYAATHQKRQAVTLLNVLAERQPTNMIWQYYMGDLYDEMGDEKKAIKHFELATQAERERPEPYIRLATIYLRGNQPKAAETITNALHAAPQEPLLYTFLGLVLSHGRSLKDSIKAFERAEQIVNESGGKKELNPLFYFWYGAACEQDGQYQRAEGLMQKSIELYPEADEPYNYLAYMWAEQGTNLDKATTLINQALKLKPEEPAYQDTLGWIYFKKGEYAKALVEVRKAVTAMPDDSTITEHMGDIYSAMGKTDEAIKHWKKSLLLDVTNDKVRQKLRQAGADPDRGASRPSKGP